MPPETTPRWAGAPIADGSGPQTEAIVRVPLHLAARATTELIRPESTPTWRIRNTREQIISSPIKSWISGAPPNQLPAVGRLTPRLPRRLEQVSLPLIFA